MSGPALPTNGSPAALYFLYAVPITAATVVLMSLVLALFWRDTQYMPAMRLNELLIVLGLAGLAQLLICALPQLAYVRRVAHAGAAGPTPRRFMGVFYAINLGISVVMSVLGLPILLGLIFYYFLVPVSLWLIPYHLLIGWLLGQALARRAPQAA